MVVGLIEIYSHSNLIRILLLFDLPQMKFKGMKEFSWFISSVSHFIYESHMCACFAKKITHFFTIVLSPSQNESILQINDTGKINPHSYHEVKIVTACK